MAKLSAAVSHQLLLTTPCTFCKAAKDAGARKAARIRELYRDGRRRCHLFDDIHCYATAAAARRESGRDRLPAEPVLRTAAYYIAHLGCQAPPVLVLSEELCPGPHRLPALAGPVPGPAAAGSGSGGSNVGQLSSQQRGTVQVMPLAEYLKQHQSDKPQLLELCASLAAAAKEAAEAVAAPATKQAYAKHLPMRALQDGLEQGTLLQGTLEVSSSDHKEAVVHIVIRSAARAEQQLVRVVGRAHRSRAMHGDLVVVRLLPEGTQGPGSGRQHQACPAEDEAAAEDDLEPKACAGMLADAMLAGAAGSQGSGLLPGAAQPLQLGMVVGILRRAVLDVAACLAAADEAVVMMGMQGGGRGRAVPLLCIPLDRRLPPIRIRSQRAAALVGKRFVVRLDSWERSAACPSGHLMRIIGNIMDPACEAEALLVQCGVPLAPFCAAAMQELPIGVEWTRQGRCRQPAVWQVPDAERARRLDLSNNADFFLLSIGRRGAADIEALLHARALAPNVPFIGHASAGSSMGGSRGHGGKGSAAGGASSACYEVGVHIADVAAFVRAGGALDMEARARAMSVHVPHQDLGMLPSVFSSEVCSLHKGYDRLAVSIVWALDRRLEVVDRWMGRTLVRSSATLHFKQAQHLLDNDPLGPKWDRSMTETDIRRTKATLRLATSFAAKLGKRRQANGAVDIKIPELRFKLDEETDDIVGVMTSQQLPVAAAWDELMVAAGAAAAHCIACALPGASLLTCSPKPPPSAFEQLSALMETAGLKLNTSTSRGLSSSLHSACTAVADPAAAALLQQLAAGCLAASRYVSSGDAAPGSQACVHYGLAIGCYTQCTSPITRYPDLIVQRQLVAILDHERKVWQHQQQQLQRQQRSLLQQPAPWQQQRLPPLLPPYSHPELVQLGDYLNVRLADGKRAQALCFQLHLMLLFHGKPRAEQALVYAIHPGSGSRSNSSASSTHEGSKHSTITDVEDKDGSGSYGQTDEARVNPPDSVSNTAQGDASVATSAADARSVPNHAQEQPSLLVYVGAYHVMGRVMLADRDGITMPPLGHDEDDVVADEADDQEQGGHADIAHPAVKEATKKHTTLHVTESHVTIMDTDSDQVLLDCHLLDKVWVRLSANANRAHGPQLCLTLLQGTHPDVVEAIMGQLQEPTRTAQRQARSSNKGTLRQRHQQQQPTGHMQRKQSGPGGMPVLPPMQPPPHGPLSQALAWPQHGPAAGRSAPGFAATAGWQGSKADWGGKGGGWGNSGAWGSHAGWEPRPLAAGALTRLGLLRRPPPPPPPRQISKPPDGRGQTGEADGRQAGQQRQIQRGYSDATKQGQPAINEAADGDGTIRTPATASAKGSEVLDAAPAGGPAVGSTLEASKQGKAAVGVRSSTAHALRGAKAAARQRPARQARAARDSDGTGDQDVVAAKEACAPPAAQEQRDLQQKWQEQHEQQRQAAAAKGQAPQYMQVLPAAVTATSEQLAQLATPDGEEEQEQDKEDEQQGAKPAKGRTKKGIRASKAVPGAQDQYADQQWISRMNDRALWGAVLDREQPAEKHDAVAEIAKAEAAPAPAAAAQAEPAAAGERPTDDGVVKAPAAAAACAAAAKSAAPAEAKPTEAMPAEGVQAEAASTAAAVMTPQTNGTAGTAASMKLQQVGTAAGIVQPRVVVNIRQSWQQDDRVQEAQAVLLALRTRAAHYEMRLLHKSHIRHLRLSQAQGPLPQELKLQCTQSAVQMVESKLAELRQLLLAA